MKTDEREQDIIGILENRGEMTVVELSRILDISVSTLRKQLSKMQSKNLIIRTYGGVMSVNRAPDEAFDTKLHKMVPEKNQIAAFARTLIESGSSISLGSGSTIYCLCNQLDDIGNATIYTNSMQAAEYLSRCTSLDVHICGGIIRSKTGTIIGNETTQYFKHHHADYAFISCDAIDASGNVYSDNIAVGTAEQAVIKNAKRKYILSDSTKFGKSSVAQIINLNECDGLITNNSSDTIANIFESITKVYYA